MRPAYSLASGCIISAQPTPFIRSPMRLRLSVNTTTAAPVRLMAWSPNAIFLCCAGRLLFTRRRSLRVPGFQ